MALVVRLGPLPLGRRRAVRVGELERIFATAVDLLEVVDVAAFATAVEMHEVLAVALDALALDNLDGVLAAAGARPVLRPLWRRERNSRGELDEMFDGYGLLTLIPRGVERDRPMTSSTPRPGLLSFPIPFEGWPDLSA